MVKKVAVEEDLGTDFDRLSKEIQKSFGDVITAGLDFKDKKREIVSVGPALDFITGGGIVEGSTVLLSSKAKVGKTTTAMSVCANATKMGKHVLFCNAEGRFKDLNLQIDGLDLSKFYLVESKPGQILSAESYLSISEKFLKTVMGGVCVIDSIGFLASNSEMQSEMHENAQIGGVSKLLYKFHKKICNVLPVNNSILIYITHLQDAIGNPYGGAREVGGNAIKFGYDYGLRAKAMEYWTKSKEDDPIGQKIKWLCTGSALTTPGKECHSYIRYGKGIDSLQELIQFGIDLAIVVKSGAWFSLSFAEGFGKFQGEANLYDAIAANDEVRLQLEKNIKEVLSPNAS